MKPFKQNLRMELILYDQEKLFLISLSFIRLLTCIQFTRLHFTRSTSNRMKRKSKLCKEGYLTVLNVERCCFKSFLKHEDCSIRSVSKHRVARSNILNTRGAFHLMSRNRELIYQTREAVFHLIPKHREVIC